MAGGCCQRRCRLSLHRWKFVVHRCTPRLLAKLLINIKQTLANIYDGIEWAEKVPRWRRNLERMIQVTNARTVLLCCKKKGCTYCAVKESLYILL